jgi:3-methyladenine DNA glycosylase AlkD
MDIRRECARILAQVQTVSDVVTLREIAQDWQRAHPKIPSEPLFTLVEALWNAGSREARLVALYMLESYPRHIPALGQDRLDCWRHDLDSRRLTDTLAQTVFGAWLLANPAHRFGHLWDQLIWGDVWNRRLALMATIPLNRARADVSHPGVTLFLVDQVKDARKSVVTEAVVRALQALGEKRPTVVLAYVDANCHVLVPTVIRDVETALCSSS